MNTHVTNKSISRLGIYIFLFCAVFVAMSSQAGSLKKHGFDDVLVKADLVVVGRCLSIESTWVNKKIISKASIQVDKVIKGKSGDTIIVEYLGGDALHPTLNIPVAMKSTVGVNFSEGDEAVLLLNRMPKGNYRLVDVSIGKISIVTDIGSGKKHIKSGFKKITSTKKDDGSTELKPREMKLDEFYSFVENRSKNIKGNKGGNK